MDFQKHIQKAEEALRRRNYDFAIELYRQLIELDPNLGDARGGLRRALLDKQVAGKKKSGMFGKLKGAGPLAAAKGFMKASKFDAAAKALETYLGANPDSEEGTMLLGQSLEAAGHNDSALAVYEFLAELAPARGDGWRQAGILRLRNGDTAEAMRCLEKALEADPRDREAQKARKDLAAEVALEGGGLDNVGHSREKMVDAGAYQAQERRRRMHRSESELQGDLERLETAYAEDPKNPDLMVEMGSTLEELKDLDGALAMYRRALSYKKESVEIASKVETLGIKSKKKALAKAGKSGDQALADRLEGELAVLELRRLEGELERNPGAQATRLELGRLLFARGDLDGALAHLQKVAPDPRLGSQARFFLARCFHKKGLLDLAQKAFEAALPESLGRDGQEMDGRSCEILYHLGLIA
ncbi:MAG: tetratricopeptide repeat protein, partial [Planctomycetota bacterium]|nr:tetratricopeptide repeat protein [Planctomycetota bacterium]